MYSTSGGVLLVAPREDAERNSRLHDGLRCSRTWGELRATVDRVDYQDILDRLHSEGIYDQGEEPEDAEPFEADDVPGHADGDYPEWLQQSMLDWFPDDLVEEYFAESAFNGEFLHIPEADAEAVINRLQQEGHTLTKSDVSLM
ncbi:hypothetical protein ACQCX5_03690 [Propionibacteriaceae bacterium G57]|uniref:hypothetical protein n=1 Tax=Aestuariimicrobium sp. G57 TaxID=3418485 RepID=UPI003DA784EC